MTLVSNPMSLDFHQKPNSIDPLAPIKSAKDGVNGPTIPTDGIENAVFNINNSTNTVTFNHRSSPLQPKRMNTPLNRHLNGNEQVNKLSVSFAAETTTTTTTALASLLSEEEEENNDKPSSSRLSILDATTDDDFGKPYRRSRRQRKSVGYYKWLATNSPNEFIDKNGNPRKMVNGVDDTNSSSCLEDSIDTQSSSEYEEEESEYIFDEDISNEELEEQAMHGDAARGDSEPPSEEHSSMIANEAAPTALESNCAQDQPTVSATESPASPTKTILSEEVAKNQVVLSTPLRRSPRKRRSIMPGEDTTTAGTSSSLTIVQEHTFKEPSKDVVSVEGLSQDPAPTSPRRILSEQVGSLQRVITTPLRRSPRKRRCVQSDEAKLVPKEQDLSANEILSQPSGNLQQVVSTPIRRSPGKRRSIQGEGTVTTMSSIVEQGPLAQVVKEPFTPPRAASNEAAVKSEPKGEASTSNGILAEQVEKNHQVIATPLRRSPRKRRSLQNGDSAVSFMASIEQEALSPIMKISSPPAVPRAKAITMTQMTTDADTFSNSTKNQSPLDDEMKTTPVTQSPFASPAKLESAREKPQISITTPVRRSPRKKEGLEVNEPDSIMSPFAAAELSPIQRETPFPVAAPAVALESPESPLASPLACQNTSELHDSMRLEAASTSMLSSVSQQSEGGTEESVNTESSDGGVMNIDENNPQTESLACVANAEKSSDEASIPSGHGTKNELEVPFDKANNSFVLEYCLEHKQAATVSEEPVTSTLPPAHSKCYKVRVVFDKSPPRPLKSILRAKLRYSKSDNNNQDEEEPNTTVLKEHYDEIQESDDTSSHGISLPELKHRMAILFSSDYSQLIQSSCDSARLFACFTLFKDAQFVENESMVQTEQQPTKTAARARTRRRRLSLESKTPGINYLRPIMPFLNELVQLELVQYQSMGMAKLARGAASNHSSPNAEQGSPRVHFPAFNGSALQPPSDVIEGSDRVREESIEQLCKVVKASQALFGTSDNDLYDRQSENETKFDSRSLAVGVLKSLVQYLQADFVTHGHSAPCSLSFPFKSHLGSRVEKAAQSYAHDLSHILRNASNGETLGCLTFPHSSHDVSVVNRMMQSSRGGPWECRLADNAGQQIRYWLRTLLNPIPDRAPPKSASNGAKAKQWRCRICDIVALCVEDAEQSMAVEDGSMSSLVSDALSFLYAFFGVSTWDEFVAEAESGLPSETSETRTGKRRRLPDSFFSASISLKQKTIFPHQWNALEDEMRVATEFLAAMNAVRFLYELFSILVNESKYHKVWKKTIQDFAEKLALVDEACIQSEDVQLLLLRTPIEEILKVLEKISQQHSSKYIQCQKQLKEFSKRFAFGKKSKRKRKHQRDLCYLETAYEETMEKINFPRAIRL